MTIVRTVIFAVLLLGMSAAEAQSGPFDIERQLREAIRRAVGTVTLDPATQNMAHKAIYQYGLAPVVVGFTRNGSAVGYRLVLLVTVPTNINETDEARVRRMISGLIEPIAGQLQTELDALPGLEEAAATATTPNEDVKRHFDGYAAATEAKAHEIFVGASHQFSEQFARYFPNYAGSSFLAIGLRPCAEPSCPLNAFAHKARNRSTDRFGKLYHWMRADGLTTVNQAYILNPQGTFWSITAKLDEGYQWHDDFPKIALQATLVNAAKRARRTSERLSYSAAELAELPREAVAHIADAFDSPYAAAVHLPSDQSFILPGISDEIGRARLTECVRLRGTFDINDAGKCAGYNLTQGALATCLSGGECAPPFGGEVNLDSLVLTAHTSLSYFAQNADLPRVDLGKEDQVAKSVNQCNSQNVGNAGYCLVKASLTRDPKTKATIDCVERASHGTGAIASCALQGASKETQSQIACFQNNSRNYKDLALCATREALPSTAQRLVSCATDRKQSEHGFEEAALCLGAQAGSREAQCLAKYKGNWQDSALCISGDHTPPQVQSALHCAETSSSLTGFGVCMVANEGSGEAQRIAACYVEAQGIPAAVAVCLAAKDLTQDQRIVLECAAQTSGALPATAICSAGKLAVKEMMNCRSKNFGEGNCFSESNELRQLAKRFGMDIGPHSVVADVVNIQLKIADVTTTPIVNAGTQVIGDVTKFANDNKLLPEIPDPKHPETLVPGAAAAKKVVDNYCDHNCCSASCLPAQLPQIRF